MTDDPVSSCPDCGAVCIPSECGPRPTCMCLAERETWSPQG